MKVSIRSVEQSDLSFIFSTWLKGLYHGNVMFNKIEQDLFYFKYHQVIEALLKRSVIKIACLEDEPDVILGYSITEPGKLHWVFVKKAWRKLGIGKSLLLEDIAEVSHLTKLGEMLLKKTKWKFNPFI